MQREAESSKAAEVHVHQTSAPYNRPTASCMIFARTNWLISVGQSIACSQRR